MFPFLHHGSSLTNLRTVAVKTMGEIFSGDIDSTIGFASAAFDTRCRDSDARLLHIESGNFFRHGYK
jgi:hypothetical protein